MNSQAGRENRQVKVNPRKRCQTERDGKQIQSLHGKSIGRNKSMSRASLAWEQMAKSE
jgi:hypothetical protein